MKMKAIDPILRDPKVKKIQELEQQVEQLTHHTKALADAYGTIETYINGILTLLYDKSIFTPNEFMGIISNIEAERNDEKEYVKLISELYSKINGLSNQGFGKPDLGET